LIDADLRCPFQHSYFKLENDKGLASSILDGAPIKAVCQKVEGYDLLDVVVAGTANGKAFDRVGQRVAELLVESAKEYDLIIVDAPPMLGLAEPIQIACVADGVLVIGHAGATNQQAITTVLGTLERVHANVIGLVLNQVRQNMSESYQRYRSYYPYATRLASKAG
jgi:Mrp family chromosome partitioning ATPase